MPRKTVLVAACSILLLGAGIVAAVETVQAGATRVPVDMRPDLVVVSIDFKEFHTYKDASGVLKGWVLPSFTYKNQGRTRSGPFQIAWEYWDKWNNAWIPFLGQFFTNNLAPGQSWTEGGQMADQCGWTIGVDPPRFRVRLDTGSAVAESDETNNNMVREFKPKIVAPVPSLIPKSKP